MIAHKYSVGQEIKRGAFGIILKGLYEKKNEPIAIKIEYGNMQTLKHEVKMMNYLYTHGVRKIPSIYWYGIHNTHPCLVLTFYECSLMDYIKTREMTIQRTNAIMLKIIDILETIHKYYVLHRDIKPQNFMIKAGELFLIDFGLATFFIDENGDHYENTGCDSLVGTPKFASINVHHGNKYSRRDDMISVGYMYFYMLLGEVMWFSSSIHVPATNLPTCSLTHPINLWIKQQKDYQVIMDGLSNRTDLSHICNYIKHMYDMKYEAQPKYEVLSLYFRNVHV
jgi:casein kinase 1